MEVNWGQTMHDFPGITQTHKALLKYLAEELHSLYFISGTTTSHMEYKPSIMPQEITISA